MRSGNKPLCSHLHNVDLSTLPITVMTSRRGKSKGGGATLEGVTGLELTVTAGARAMLEDLCIGKSPCKLICTKIKPAADSLSKVVIGHYVFLVTE